MLTQFEAAWSFLKAAEDDLMAEIQRQIAAHREKENKSQAPVRVKPSERTLAFPRKRNNKNSIPIRNDESNEEFKLGPSYKDKVAVTEGSQMQIDEQQAKILESLKNKVDKKNSVAVKPSSGGGYADDEHKENVRADWLDSMSDDESQRFEEHKEDFNTLGALTELKRQGIMDDGMISDNYGEHLANGASLLSTPESERDGDWQKDLKGHGLAHGVHTDDMDGSFDGYDEVGVDDVRESNKQFAEDEYGQKEQEEVEEEEDDDDLISDDYVMPGSLADEEKEKKSAQQTTLMAEIQRQIAAHKKNNVGVINSPQMSEEDYDAGN